MFNSYEELMAAVEERRQEILTLEVDLGTKFSPEYEQAKQKLAEAKAMKSIVGQSFLGGDEAELAALEAQVAATRPPARAVWVQFSKLDLDEWAKLIRTQASAVDQYERILHLVFKGVYGQDPVQPEDWADTHPDEVWEKPAALTMDPLSVSSKGGAKAVLPGGALNSVIQNFMAWQNSGGEVSIRPTKSGQD